MKLFKKNSINWIVSVIIIFFYLYPIAFKIIPIQITTRIIFSIIGFLLFMKDCIIYLLNKKHIYIDKDWVRLLSRLILIAFIASISLLYNSTSDFQYITYPISMLLIIYSGYFVFKCFKIFSSDMDISVLIEYIIIAVFIQNLIAFFMFINPSFSKVMTEIQYQNELSELKLNELLEIRFIGFGSTYFGAGIVNGLALILISYFLKSKKHPFSKLLKLSVFYIIILGFGMMMARTTIIGLVLSIAYMLLPKAKLKFDIIKNHLKFIIGIIMIVFTGYLILLYVFPLYFDSLNVSLRFGFEMFYNYFEHGTFETLSTNQMKDMYVYPTNIKTYIIGDGLWDNPTNQGMGYYMDTDIGYLRLIYYFGIVGLLCYLFFQFYSIKLIINKTENIHLKKMLVLLFLYMLILNFKGFSDIFFILLIFYFIIKNEKHLPIQVYK